MRQTIGSGRYHGEHACSLMARVYEPLRLHVNYFQPSLKLIFTERDGAHVIKHYDTAKTPLQRLIGDVILPEKELERLTRSYNGLNPMELQSASRMPRAAYFVILRSETQMRQRRPHSPVLW